MGQSQERGHPSQEGMHEIMDGLQIREEHENDLYRVVTKGDLLITNANDLQDLLDAAVKQGLNDILLDMLEVNYIDSFGIGVIVKTKSQVDKKKGRFKVLVNPVLMNLFEKCHLDEYIDLELVDED